MATPRLEAGALFRERYRLETPLGKGGMGEVWRALDERLRRYVAIKVLRSDVTQDPTCADRFRREALATARVTHPNLVAVFDIEVDHDPPFIAMEFLDGPTVARELKKGPFTEARALAVAEQSLRALAALHAVGIVHRDIKPGNIMVVSTGGVETTKVVDLGIAQLMTGTVYQRLTSTGAIVGTPAYMAPEMLEGLNAAPAADVWAIGVVLFALLTGRKPFADADLAELVQSVLVPTPAPDVRVFAPAISSQTAVFVSALLEKSLLRRPASAAEALQLMAHLHGPPQRFSLEPHSSFTPRLSLEPRHSLTPAPVALAPVSFAPVSFAPPQPHTPTGRTLPWALALLAGSVMTLVFATLIGFAFVTYARRTTAAASVVAPSTTPTPAPILPVAASPAPTPTVAVEPLQIAVIAPAPLNGAQRAYPEPSRSRALSLDRHGGPATNGFTSPPSADFAAPSAGFAAPASMHSSTAEGYGTRAAQLPSMAQLHVSFSEPAFGIRNSFDAHTRNMSGRCGVLQGPPGVEFARFVVSQGHVTRNGISGQASPREVSCVITTLSGVDWRGGNYHLTIAFSTSSR